MLKPITKIIMYRRNPGFSFLSFSFLLYFIPPYLLQKRIKIHLWVLRVVNIWCGGIKKTMDTIENRLQKKFIMQIVTCLLLALVFMPNSADAGDIKAFHWVDDEDYPPLIYRGTDGKPVGIFYEIMTAAFRRLDIPLKVELYPWARAQRIVADGEADGMVTILTDARKPFFLDSDPILLVCEHIFVNRNNPRIKEIMSIRSLKEIRPFKLVETIGSGWAKENLQGFNITWVPDMDSAFNMLIKGRVDIFLANSFTGAAFIKKKIKAGKSFSEGYKSIITNPYPLKTIAFRLLVRNDSPFAKVLDDFNDTIHQMQMDGTIQHIREGAQLSLRDDARNQK